VSVVKALRTPGTGCPWDLEQDHQTLRPYLIEETYEVLDAIDRGEDGAFRDELGDLLLQVVLHAQLADDRNAFSITEVVRGIMEKMVRRHPHVFGSVQVSGSAEVSRNWEQIKAAEIQNKGGESSTSAKLARIPRTLPALLFAHRVGEKAARAHPDGGPPAEVLAGVRESLTRLEEQIQNAPAGFPSEQQQAPIEDALGNVLFSLCQLARSLGLSAEDSLRAWTSRFIERFEQWKE
jgi:MazG family protein